ncbi:hypothetical protein GWI33_014867 [Rhynchophorus ferrugineus]|uniref:C2H2-type domain-containing protein n=1 Tax=Rhynchophorus ferrugineus TaxID=354439 RepID=A0A834I665_RHYFE|nr:hypothetical protein GWI33_014867 [Rhynchophorus ferrugineus]
MKYNVVPVHFLQPRTVIEAQETKVLKPRVDNANPASRHVCPACSREYKLKSSLRNHRRWECGKEPQFQCPFCTYKAKQKMHVNRHIERMHHDADLTVAHKISRESVGVNITT